MCDEYFETKLNQTQFEGWIKELQELAHPADAGNKQEK
jgi:hypothetical protein